MQPSDPAHPPRTYGPSAPSPLSPFPPIPSVSPMLPGPPPRPPVSSAGAQPGPSSRPPGRPAWAPEPIPPIEELRPSTARGLNRLNAPNLTTYIEHYHYYYFAGNCTVYQAPDATRPRPVQIVSDRPPAHPERPHASPAFAQPSHHVPSSPYSRDAAHRQAYPDHHQQQHRNSVGAFPASSEALPVIAPLHSAPIEFSGPPHQQQQRHDAVHAHPAQQHDPHSDPMIPSQFRGRDAPRELPSMVTYERPVKRSRALSLPNAGQLRRVGVDSRSTTALATPRSPLNSAPGPAAIAAGLSNSSSLSDGRSPSRRKTVPVVRATNESDLMMNDWEHVVNMYMTGEGTRDGRPLRNITRGDGRRVEDRKLLEKRRTIGKTFERLGRPLFEAAIGYKMEGKYRRKQKMYHVIARCRVVNGLRKAGDDLPTDAAKLTALIDQRLQEKAARNAMLSEQPNHFRRQQQQALEEKQQPAAALLAAVAAQQPNLPPPPVHGQQHNAEGEHRELAPLAPTREPGGIAGAQKRRHS